MRQKINYIANVLASFAATKDYIINQDDMYIKDPLQYKIIYE